MRFVFCLLELINDRDSWFIFVCGFGRIHVQHKIICFLHYIIANSIVLTIPIYAGSSMPVPRTFSWSSQMPVTTNATYGHFYHDDEQVKQTDVKNRTKSAPPGRAPSAGPGTNY